MKRILLILTSMVTCTASSWAADFPISLGAGSDTVFLKTGVSPNWESHTSVHLDLSARLYYDQQMRVRQITVSAALQTNTPPPSLGGVSLSASKEDVVTMLGQPTATFSKEPDEATDLYRLVWQSKDRLLIVAFWQSDQASGKWKKDTVAYISLRTANL